MDGENNGSKPYEQMGWFGGFSHYFWINTHMHYHMDVSKKGTPKWMVKIMVPNPMNKWDGLEGFPIIFGSTPTCTTTWMFPKRVPQNGW